MFVESTGIYQSSNHLQLSFNGKWDTGVCNGYTWMKSNEKKKEKKIIIFSFYNSKLFEYSSHHTNSFCLANWNVSSVIHGGPPQTKKERKKGSFAHNHTQMHRNLFNQKTKNIHQHRMSNTFYDVSCRCPLPIARTDVTILILILE